MDNISVLCVDNCSATDTDTANISRDLALFSNAAIANAQYVWWICYPILLACCTIGNLLNLFVLWRQAKRTSTNSYMIAMAVSGLFVLWFYFPVFLYNISSAFHLPYHTPEHRATLYRFLGTQAWVQETFMHLSDWTLVMFSVERLVAFVKPFWIIRLSTASSANIIVLILFLLSAVFSLELFVYEIYKHRDPNQLPAWLTTWEEIHHAAELSVQFCVFLALLLINSALIVVIRQQNRHAIVRLGSTRSPKPNQSRNTNIILLSSATLYLVCQFPSLLIKSLELADELGTRAMESSEWRFAAPFCNVTLMANYSINFFLYVTVSERYRRQLKLVLWTCCVQGAPCPMGVGGDRALESEYGRPRTRTLQVVLSNGSSSSECGATHRVVRRTVNVRQAESRF